MQLQCDAALEESEGKHVLLSKLKYVASLIVICGGFHISHHTVLRFNKMHTCDCWWAFRNLLPSLNICPAFPTGKPSIIMYDHLLDQIGIYIDGMCLSAFKFFGAAER